MIIDPATAIASNSPSGDIAPLRDFMAARAPHIVHAAGRYRAALRALQAGQANGRQSTPALSRSSASATNTTAAKQARNNTVSSSAADSARRQSVNGKPSAVQTALKTAGAAGLIPLPFVGALLTVTDVLANPARRSEAAVRAAFDMAKIENTAFAAVPHLAQLRAMNKAHATATDAVKAASGRISQLLGDIYKRPDQAADAMRRMAVECRGTGHLAREVGQMPELLGDLRGGFFKRAERNEAVSKVPLLVSAIEDRGRSRARLSKDDAGLRDLQRRPDSVPALKEALRAHSVLDAVRGAMPGVDEVNSTTLLAAAHEAALATTPADLAEAHDVSPQYREHLEDQTRRLGAIRSLQEGRDPSRAVDHFERSAQVMADNVNAHERLKAEGNVYPAQQAYVWAETAQKEMGWAATTIMSDYNQHSEATQRQLLPHVVAFHNTMEAAEHEPEAETVMAM